MPGWLRWLLVLPASIAAYLGIQIVVGLLSELINLPWFIPSGWEDVYQDWISQGLNSVVGPVALIYAGVRTSPRGHRFQTSVALAVLLGGLAAFSLFLPQQSSPRWWLLTTTAASVITVIAVCIQIQGTEGGNGVVLEDQPGGGL